MFHIIGISTALRFRFPSMGIRSRCGVEEPLVKRNLTWVVTTFLAVCGGRPENTGGGNVYSNLDTRNRSLNGGRASRVVDFFPGDNNTHYFSTTLRSENPRPSPTNYRQI